MPDKSAAPELPLTEFIVAWRAGDGAGFSALIEATYAQLNEMAKGRLGGENALLTIAPQELLNEAVARVMQAPPEFKNRGHFFATMSLLMRSIIVDLARAKLTEKRGGGVANVTFTESLVGEQSIEYNIIALDAALQRLAETDPRSSNVLHLTYFAGMKQTEIAELLDVAVTTIERDLRFARALLQRAMANG